MTTMDQKTTAVAATLVLPPNMTHVVGYFNGNDFQLQLSVSALGLQFSLMPGQFILDADGHKVNDPILERYCRKGMPSLSKTLSNAPVQVKRFATQSERMSSGVAVREKMSTPSGTPAVLVNPPSVSHPGQESKAPVTSMTREQAIAAGYIKGPLGVTNDKITPIPLTQKVPAVVVDEDAHPNELLQEIKIDDDDVRGSRPDINLMKGLPPKVLDIKPMDPSLAPTGANTTSAVVEDSQKKMRFPCPLCKKPFDYQSQLNRHVKNNHRESFDTLAGLGKVTQEGVAEKASSTSGLEPKV